MAQTHATNLQHYRAHRVRLREVRRAEAAALLQRARLLPCMEHALRARHLHEAAAAATRMKQLQQQDT